MTGNDTLETPAFFRVTDSYDDSRTRFPSTHGFVRIV